jgi:hypothetical protein
MSTLKPGTLCVIIAGCPENIGLIVEVIARLGPFEGKEDAYYIRTITGKSFHQVWAGNDLIRGNYNECVTDRHKLQPLVGGEGGCDLGDEVERTDELLAG